MAAYVRRKLAIGILSAVVVPSVGACATAGQGQPDGDAGGVDGAASSGSSGSSSGGSGSSSGGNGSGTGGSSGSGSGPDASGRGADSGGSGSSSSGGRPGDADGGHDAAPATGEGGTSGWSCPAGPFGPPVPAGATAVKVAGVPPSDTFNNTLYNFTSLEGPVWIGDALYVSEYPGNPNPPPSRIIKVTGSGAVSIAVADSGSNGLAVDKNGILFGAVHEDGSISRFDLSAGMRVLPPIVSSYMGSRFNSPNDLAIRSDGTIYFSDPNFQAPSPAPQTATRVYRYSPSTSTLSVVDAMLGQPNGVTLSLDESTLFVSSTNGIQKYAVMPDGSTGPGSAFALAPNATLSVDGMAIDCAGNLYGAVVNTANIVVLGPTGAQIGALLSIPTTSGWVTNLAFGGDDHKTLYVTTQGSSGSQGLYKVGVSVPGMPY